MRREFSLLFSVFAIISIIIAVIQPIKEDAMLYVILAMTYVILANLNNSYRR